MGGLRQGLNIGDRVVDGRCEDDSTFRTRITVPQEQDETRCTEPTLQVGFGGMCVYTLRQKGIRREYCGVRGANVEEVGATDIEETKLQTPVLRIYEASVVPCPQLRPTIVACSIGLRTRRESSFACTHHPPRATK